jgi:hypothetical protein
LGSIGGDAEALIEDGVVVEVELSDWAGGGGGGGGSGGGGGGGGGRGGGDDERDGAPLLGTAHPQFMQPLSRDPPVR